MVLVLTDGLAAGWRAGAVLPLLRELGRSEPLAVLHLLPQRLWFRTGLDVHRMRLSAAHPWAPNDSLRWELRTSPWNPSTTRPPGPVWCRSRPGTDRTLPVLLGRPGGRACVRVDGDVRSPGP
ncbi:hypothetical protein StrepF001_13430 [Streptomyces sp. F001]|uniref:hypothetical protein n=1 Tax=Streptomyces sp. F001 TaxID=1510026 RepID=UPI00101E738F|nr:hypothetical protein [Streptomyces sp. F001]RZB18148.1 hypothetical protein StrepF001_13430 [Streptomyces sp. F001]